MDPNTSVGAGLPLGSTTVTTVLEGRWNQNSQLERVPFPRTESGRVVWNGSLFTRAVSVGVCSAVVHGERGGDGVSGVGPAVRLTGGKSSRMGRFSIQ